MDLFKRLILISMVALTGCSRLDQMNEGMDKSNQMISSNTVAIEKSTAAIHANAAMIQKSSDLMEASILAMEESQEQLRTLTGLFQGAALPVTLFFLTSILLLPSLVMRYSMRRLEKKLTRKK